MSSAPPQRCRPPSTTGATSTSSTASPCPAATPAGSRVGAGSWWTTTAAQSASSAPPTTPPVSGTRSEEHTSELQHANISYAVFCLKKKKAQAVADRAEGGAKTTPL